jgi:type VI secretion system secreted protein VgrG
LVAKQHRENEGTSEIYEYAGTFGSKHRGEKLAKTRLEEHAALEEKAKGESGCPRLTPGFTFKFAASGFDPAVVDYLLLAVEHVGDQPQSLDAQAGGSTEYWNGFVCVPATVNLRPSRITPKPVIPGMQSAMVTGPRGEEIYHDEFGRVKVQFHWDRQGKKDDRSSCWLRCVQGWGGGGWGMQFIPRVGDEVLVAFLDGDPDHPVIVGSLYNNSNMPLYNPLDRKTVSSIKTRSYPKGGRDNHHELRFDDKKGSEEIYLQSEKDWNILVKNDKKQTVDRDEILTVKNNRSKTVGIDQSETIGCNKTIRVGANHNEAIGADMDLVVGSNKTEEVALNSAESVGLIKKLTTGGLYQVSVGGVMNETVAGAKTEEVGLAKAVVVGANMTENVIGSRRVDVGTTLEITAGESVQIKCGKSTLRMDSAGNLFLNGVKIDFSASGVVKVSGEDILLN